MKQLYHRKVQDNLLVQKWMAHNSLIGRVFYSNDGINFSRAGGWEIVATMLIWDSIGNKWIGVGAYPIGNVGDIADNGIVNTSSDGIMWEMFYYSYLFSNIMGIVRDTYANQWIIWGTTNHGNQIATSIDLKYWTEINVSIAIDYGNINNIILCTGRYFIVTSEGDTGFKALAYSLNLTTWTSINLPTYIGNDRVKIANDQELIGYNIYDIALNRNTNDSTIIVVGECFTDDYPFGRPIAFSYYQDSLTLLGNLCYPINVNSPDVPYFITRICCNGSTWVTIGLSYSILNEAIFIIGSSTDGINFTQRKSFVFQSRMYGDYARHLYSLIWNGIIFCFTYALLEDYYWYSYDGISWYSVDVGLKYLNVICSRLPIAPTAP